MAVGSWMAAMILMRDRQRGQHNEPRPRHFHAVRLWGPRGPPVPPTFPDWGHGGPQAGQGLIAGVIPGVHALTGSPLRAAKKSVKSDAKYQSARGQCGRVPSDLDWFLDVLSRQSELGRSLDPRPVNDEGYPHQPRLRRLSVVAAVPATAARAVDRAQHNVRRSLHDPDRHTMDGRRHTRRHR